MAKRVANNKKINDSCVLNVRSEHDILKAAEQILRRRLKRLSSISDPYIMSKWLRVKLAGEEREHFLVVFLDARHRIIASETMFMGTVDGAEVHPREVVKAALSHNAAAVVCAHNHPSGSLDPSTADKLLTAQLKQALAMVDVRLLDHFVVSIEGATSLAERGWV